MKFAPQTPLVQQAKIAMIQAAELHTATVDEAGVDEGEGVVQAYLLNDVLVVTASGELADRITRLLDAADIADAWTISAKRIEEIKAAA